VDYQYGRDGLSVEDFTTHVRDEHSTYPWILSGPLDRAGLDVDNWRRQGRRGLPGCWGGSGPFPNEWGLDQPLPSGSEKKAETASVVILDLGHGNITIR
jgi:hypothetical protein